MTIDGPRRKGSYPDRDIDCEEALESEFSVLAERAEAAGWSVNEIARALGCLAIAYRLGRQADEATDLAIAAAKRRGRKQ